MRIVAALVAALVLTGCGEEKIVYVDKDSGEIIQTADMMQHEDQPDIVCIEGVQYYKWEGGYTPSYLKRTTAWHNDIMTCDRDTLANGDQR